MNKEDEDNLLNWLKDKDVSEVMSLLMNHGNRFCGFFISRTRLGRKICA